MPAFAARHSEFVIREDIVALPDGLVAERQPEGVARYALASRLIIVIAAAPLLGANFAVFEHRPAVVERDERHAAVLVEQVVTEYQVNVKQLVPPAAECPSN